MKRAKTMPTLGEIRGAALLISRSREWSTRLNEGVGKYRVTLSLEEQARRLREIAARADRLAALARERARLLDEMEAGR
jgi:hypothetical protein